MSRKADFADVAYTRGCLFLCTVLFRYGGTARNVFFVKQRLKIFFLNSVVTRTLRSALDIAVLAPPTT